MLFNKGFHNRFYPCRLYNVSTGCFLKHFCKRYSIPIVKKLNNNNFRVCVLVQSRIHTIVIIAPQFHSNDNLIMVAVCVTCETHYDEWHLAHPFSVLRWLCLQFRCSTISRGVTPVSAGRVYIRPIKQIFELLIFLSYT